MDIVDILDRKTPPDGSRWCRVSLLLLFLEFLAALFVALLHCFHQFQLLSDGHLPLLHVVAPFRVV